MTHFDQFLAAERDFFAYFGYFPERSAYPERHPVLDFREFHWLLMLNETRSEICWAPEPFEGLDPQTDESLYTEDILTCLGANTITGVEGGVWRGAEFTLIASETTGNDRHYLLFSNANEMYPSVQIPCET